MMRKMAPGAATAACACAAAILSLAACGSSGHPTATVTRTVTAAPSSPSPVAASSSPSPAARLTRHQAAQAYAAIVHPANRADDAAGQDATDKAPFSQFLRDNGQSITLTRRAARQLAAVRWPRSVQPYITAILNTDVPAQIRCAEALQASRNYAQVQTVADPNQACAAAQNTDNADQIRTLLGLPSLQG
jgi:hypothetical protein